jgi:spore coat polysaccharide biosynthesis protein SpsF
MSPSRTLPAILFRCDASPEIGFGHLVRCLALADELRKRDARVGFLISSSALGSETVRQQGYPAISITTDANGYEAGLELALRDFDARMLVVDVRDDLSRAHLDRLRARGFAIALLDDLSERRFAVDWSFHPPVPQVRRADWSGVHGKYFIGWEWTILRTQFAEPLPPRAAAPDSILVTMGGSDPGGMTPQAVRALESVAAPVPAVVVIGPGFQRRDEVVALLAKSRRQFRLEENVQDMRALMLHATLAVCAYGMTAFELAATGVPALYLCLTEDHVESASALDEAGMGHSLGLYSKVTDARLAAAVTDLLENADQRARMARVAPTLIDGLGARRIAEILLKEAR